MTAEQLKETLEKRLEKNKQKKLEEKNYSFKRDIYTTNLYGTILSLLLGGLLYTKIEESLLVVPEFPALFIFCYTANTIFTLIVALIQALVNKYKIKNNYIIAGFNLMYALLGITLYLTYAI